MNVGHKILFVLGGSARFISGLVGHWKLAALVIFFLSPVGPHLRWEYQYTQGYNGYRAYQSCTYLGSRGFITPDYVEGCPFVAWLDARPWV